jgi:putative sugar O-methyltransferase
LRQGDGSDLNKPSRFWQQLAEQHEGALARSGPEWVKRTQALRYFTWRWRWSVALRGEQLRFLLSQTSPLTWIRCAAARTDLSDDAWKGVTWPKTERWTYAVAVRLLWEYSRRHDDCGALSLPEPLAGHPFPVTWRGRLISQDLANSALEAAAIRRALGTREARSFLEIGAGYGRTAYVLLSVFPNSTYTIVDIEPALSLSRWYLTQLFPIERLRFLRPDEALRLASGSVDVALSISSLQEMTTEQVEGYLRLIDRVARGGIAFLKQLASWRNSADGVVMSFDEYPIPAGWTPIFREVAAVQTTFQQAAWDLPQRASQVI